MSAHAGSSFEGFEAVSTGTLGHFLTEGFMACDIQSLVRPVHVAGRALTVSTQPTDNAAVAEAVMRAQPGDVLVIDRQSDRRHACWGGLLTLAAHMAGLAGVVIDGVATDRQEISELGFPVFCRGVSALTTRRLELVASIGEPVVCGGVHVSTGDLVLGDEDGVVIVPAASAESVLAEALRREAREARMREQLQAGVPLGEARRKSAEVNPEA